MAQDQWKKTWKGANLNVPTGQTLLSSQAVASFVRHRTVLKLLAVAAAAAPAAAAAFPFDAFVSAPVSHLNSNGRWSQRRWAMEDEARK